MLKDFKEVLLLHLGGIWSHLCHHMATFPQSNHLPAPLNSLTLSERLNNKFNFFFLVWILLYSTRLSCAEKLLAKEISGAETHQVIF